MLEGVKKRFDEEGIEMPYTYTKVTLEDEAHCAGFGYRRTYRSVREK